jgi:hypothetical protein
LKYPKENIEKKKEKNDPGRGGVNNTTFMAGKLIESITALKVRRQCPLVFMMECGLTVREF